MKTFDAMKHIEKSLRQSFEDCKVSTSDQSLEMCDAKHTDENEIEVRVKLKKGSSLVKLAAKKTETRYNPGDSFEIVLKQIGS